MSRRLDDPGTASVAVIATLALMLSIDAVSGVIPTA